MVNVKSKTSLSGMLALVAAMLIIAAGSIVAPKAALAAEQDSDALAAGTTKVSTQATEVTSGDWIYVALSGTTAKLVHYNGTATNAVVPQTIDGKTVVAIGPDLLSNDYYSGGEWFEVAKVASISIPKTVKTIGEKRSRNDYSDTGVQLKHKAMQIYQIGGEDLQSITVDKKNPYFKSVKGVLFNKKGNKLCLYPLARKAKTYTIPTSVKTIANSAFMSASVNKVIISKSVRTIEPFAFAWSAVKSIVFKPGITKIGDYAFYAVENAKSITFPKTLRTIGKAAFAYTGRLNSLKLNDGLKEIGIQAFYFCQVPKNRTITIPKSVAKIKGGGFFMVDYSGNGKVTFKIPKSTKLKKGVGHAAIENEQGDDKTKIIRY